MSALITADLSRDEVISTCILLLNAGHEATVHTLGNVVKTLLEVDQRPTEGPGFVEEALRHDPPLHMFTRWVYEPLNVGPHALLPGDQIGLLLAAGNRDPKAFAAPNQFDPDRPAQPQNLSFGAGLHFCVGAPLARLELGIGLRQLFHKCPDLRLATPPRYADIYHFHGLEALWVQI